MKKIFIFFAFIYFNLNCVFAQEQKNLGKVEISAYDYILLTICYNDKEDGGGDVSRDYGELIPGHKIRATARCKMSGVKHGQLNIYDGYNLIMKTKFSNNIEVKTNCVAKNSNAKFPSKVCFTDYFGL